MARSLIHVRRQVRTTEMLLPSYSKRLPSKWHTISTRRQIRPTNPSSKQHYNFLHSTTYQLQIKPDSRLLRQSLWQYDYPNQYLANKKRLPRLPTTIKYTDKERSSHQLLDDLPSIYHLPTTGYKPVSNRMPTHTNQIPYSDDTSQRH